MADTSLLHGWTEGVVFYIGSIVAIGTSIGAIYLAGRKFKKFIDQKKTAVVVRLEKFDKTVQRVDQMYITLGPNGGKSLHDRIVNIDRTVNVGELRGRTMLNSEGIGEWQSNNDGQCTYVNAAACRMLNRQESDFLGRNWVNVIWREDRERVIEEWDVAVRERRHFQLAYRWLHIDGSPVSIVASANPVFDSAHVLIGWLALVRKVPPQQAHEGTAPERRKQ